MLYDIGIRIHLSKQLSCVLNNPATFERMRFAPLEFLIQIGEILCYRNVMDVWFELVIEPLFVDGLRLEKHGAGIEFPRGGVPRRPVAVDVENVFVADHVLARNVARHHVGAVDVVA